MAPKNILFGTKEWAPYNFNFTHGCSNDCSYCYAKEMAIRFKRKTAETWKIEEPVSMKGKSFRKRSGRIMIPSSHDITPSNIEFALDIIGKLLESGNELLIVTKPHFSCIERLVNQFQNYRAAIEFRFTIGSVSDEILRLWEPRAPDYLQRLASLRYVFEQKFSTTVSIEPLLDETPDALLDSLRPYVTDAIWIGKMNFPTRRLRANKSPMIPSTHLEALMTAQSDENIISMWRKHKNDSMIEWKESIKKVLSAHNLD